MHEAVTASLRAWEAFYIIVGSSAGALTGLQFVVIALIAESGTRATSGEISAFGTPTVVHFCAVLLVAAVVSAPWGTLSHVALALGATGLACIVYVAVVVRRAFRQRGYKPQLEDWVWHAALPFVGYVALFLAAITLQRSPESALFVLGAAALLLLFIGIHNAWDAVTFIALERAEALKREASKGRSEPPAGGL